MYSPPAPEQRIIAAVPTCGCAMRHRRLAGQRAARSPDEVTATRQAAGLSDRALWVELDRNRMARYARLYEERGAEFAFHDPDVLRTAPARPKR